LAGPRQRQAPFEVTIRFVAVSAPPDSLEADWAEDCDKIIFADAQFVNGVDHRSQTPAQAGTRRASPLEK